MRQIVVIGICLVLVILSGSSQTMRRRIAPAAPAAAGPILVDRVARSTAWGTSITVALNAGTADNRVVYFWTFAQSQWPSTTYNAIACDSIYGIKMGTYWMKLSRYIAPATGSHNAVTTVASDGIITCLGAAWTGVNQSQRVRGWGSLRV